MNENMSGNAAGLGAVLRRFRLAKGLTQRQVADQIPVNRQIYWQWECDKHRPRDDRLPALANALGCREEDLRTPDLRAEKVQSRPPATYCVLFYCKRMEDKLCCAACQNRDECEDRCLNGPERCGQSRIPTPKEVRRAEEIADEGTKKPCMGRNPMQGKNNTTPIL